MIVNRNHKVFQAIKEFFECVRFQAEPALIPIKVSEEKTGSPSIISSRPYRAAYSRDKD